MFLSRVNFFTLASLKVVPLSEIIRPGKSASPDESLQN